VKGVVAVPGSETGKGAFGAWLMDEELPARGLEVTEFARQIGVETSTIYRWRWHDPKRSMAGKVARGLGMELRDFQERFPTLAPKKKRQQRDDDEAAAARRQSAVEELAAYPEDVYREFMREVEEKRRRQADNRKGSEH